MAENIKRKNIRLSAYYHFDNAISKLNRYNLSDLWFVSSLFSLIEYYDALDRRYNFLFPLLYSDRICMLNKAILYSNSRDYKQEKFDSKYLHVILNSLNESKDASDLIDNDNNKDINNKILAYFSKLANAQFPFQNYHFHLNLARSFALYCYIPEYYKESLIFKHKRNFVDIPIVFERTFGISIKDYLLISFAIITLYMQKYNLKFKPNDELISNIDKVRNTKNERDIINLLTHVLRTVVDNSKMVRHELCFSAENLKYKDILTIDKINKYLSLTSRTSKELSQQLSKPEYNKGEIETRSCPLQRYPIIKISENKYLVPNFRYFDVSITENIHFIFQDLFPNNEFNQTYGSIFEIYVKSFIEDRLSSLQLIPEIRYKKSKNYVDSPDITLIDKINKCIIALEVKSKNISLDTRLSPLSENLIHDLDRVLKALEKLPEKIDDLYYGYDEFKDWQIIINSIPKKETLCFVVIGNGIFFMPENLNILRLNDPDHFLNSFSYKYGIIQIDNFEIALEIAHEGKDNLYNLLSQYYRTFLKTDPKERSAEQFNGILPDSNNIYLKRFSDLLFEGFSNSI